MSVKICTALLLASVLAAGCAQNGGAASTRPDSATASANASDKVPPGMNANGEVIDASKVEAGHGQQVKGINDWEGEIVGKPAPNSAFTRLQIGMSIRESTDIVGPPTDQGAYITGKAFIPFYFGSDRHRYELVYKGEGRLIFAGGSFGDYSSGHLIWIIHCATEPGYR
jgi:hypothetical protein